MRVLSGIEKDVEEDFKCKNILPIGTTISALATTQAHAATTHTVKSGESVWSISHKYGISIAKLKSLNG